MGCNCLNKKTEDDNEINNIDDEQEKKSEPEIQNNLDLNEYDNVLLTEKNEKNEQEEEITNL